MHRAMLASPKAIRKLFIEKTSVNFVAFTDKLCLF